VSDSDYRFYDADPKRLRRFLRQIDFTLFAAGAALLCLGVYLVVQALA
jgi:hypothetical protein